MIESAVTKRLMLGLLAAGLTLGAATSVLADDEELKREIEMLKKRLQELEQRVPGQGQATDADIDNAFMDDGKGASWADRTSLGGYGEMHLSFGDKREIDFHRWVLFVNHEFTDRIRFFSELELEHSLSGEGKNGEVELEQAYVEFDLFKGLRAKGGLFLIPIGILNETHEPATFFGTERNPIEQEIIPTTWWEGGAGIGQVMENGVQWDLNVHSGLQVSSTDYRIRSGRNKVSEADASEWATTARVRYTGIPGVEFGVSGQYQSDITPGVVEQNDSLLGEAHVDLKKGGFGLRALAAYWNIDGSTPEALGLDEQWGYFVEPSYTFVVDEIGKLGVFGRYNKYDASKGRLDQVDVGLNYWPIDNVVIKADYSYVDFEGKESEDIYNLGIGYQF